jgi:aryl-alcohol dehydrogenase-like predicted oxidoreductase
MLNDLAALAQSLGCTQAQLALAWAIANQDVSVALLGFTKLEQIHENLKAVEVLRNWTQEIEDKCNQILNNTPDQELDYTRMTMI